MRTPDPTKMHRGCDRPPSPPRLGRGRDGTLRGKRRVAVGNGARFDAGRQGRQRPVGRTTSATGRRGRLVARYLHYGRGGRAEDVGLRVGPITPAAEGQGQEWG